MAQINKREAELLEQLKAVTAKVKVETDPAKQAVLKKEAVKIISELFAPEAKLAVANIESTVETTKNRYGAYLQHLSGFKGTYRLAYSIALVQAGANKQGVMDALKILGSNQ